MVDPDVIARKLAVATARIQDVERLVDRPVEAFLEDLQGRDLTAFYSQLVIQDCIDVASHWVSESGWTPPSEAGAAFDILADHGIIDRDLAMTMRSAVGLRNRIAHGYATVDHAKLYREAREGITELKRFLAQIADVSQI